MVGIVTSKLTRNDTSLINVVVFLSCVFRNIINTKMKKLVFGLMLLAGIVSTPAYSKPYVSGSFGLGMLGDWKEVGWPVIDKFNNSVVWNGAVGYNFGTYRLEAAVGYENPNYKYDSSSDASLLTVMANGYYDINQGSAYSPYVMAGAGVADVNVSWNPSNGTRSFVWQVGAGLGFKVDDNITLDLGYRYIKTEGLECPKESADVSLSSQHIMAGIRYQF